MPWINRYSACGGIWVRGVLSSSSLRVWDQSFLQHAMSVGLTCLIDERERLEPLVNPKSVAADPASAARRVQRVLRRGRK